MGNENKIAILRNQTLLILLKHCQIFGSYNITEQIRKLFLKLEARVTNQNTEMEHAITNNNT